MALAAGEIPVPRTHVPEEVESSPFYQKAPMSKLVAVPEPQRQAPALQAEIPQAVRDAITRKVRKLGREYSVDVSGDLKWESSDHETRVDYRSADGACIAMHFDQKGTQVTFAYLSGLRLTGEKIPSEAPERFERYAEEFHTRTFGFSHPAERETDDRIRVTCSAEFPDVHWRVVVSGAAMLREASFRAVPDPQNGHWRIYGSPGPTASEIKANEELLQKEPTKISESEAVAIAWKNWKALGTALNGTADYQIHCQLKEGSAGETEPWEDLAALDYDKKAWRNTAAREGPPDPVFYEVQIRRHFATASVLVDRIDGKVIRINQGRMGW